MTASERLTAALAGAVGGVLGYLILESLRAWMLDRQLRQASPLR